MFAFHPELTRRGTRQHRRATPLVARFQFFQERRARAQRGARAQRDDLLFLCAPARAQRAQRAPRASARGARAQAREPYCNIVYILKTPLTQDRTTVLRIWGAYDIQELLPVQGDPLTQNFALNTNIRIKQHAGASQRDEQ